MSLLVLTCLQHVLMYQKVLQAFETEHQHFYKLEAIAMQLANSNADKDCIEYGDAANQVMSRLKKGEGCVLKVGSLKYRYVIENLGDFPCLRVKTNLGRFSTHHIRVSVLLLSDEGPDSLIQLRRLIPINLQPCIGEENQVNSGISSWRFITGFP